MKFRNYRYIPVLLSTAALGFCTKYYKGNYRSFFNDSLSGMVYVVFWCVFFRLVFPGAKTAKIAILVTSFTCLLEFLQLWQPQFLVYVRQFWIGKTLLGTTFNWSDFPWYLLGGVFGYLLIKAFNPLCAVDLHK